MNNIIACNLGSYLQFRAGAYAHLAEIGLMNVEVGVPSAESVDALQSELDAHGLTATSFLGKCDVQSETVVADFPDDPWILRPQMGVKIIFASVHAGDADRNAVYNRLRAIGENAASAGIKICLETHPDMVHNGDIALETMKAVNHPNICVNFRHRQCILLQPQCDGCLGSPEGSSTCRCCSSQGYRWRLSNVAFPDTRRRRGRLQSGIPDVERCWILRSFHNGIRGH